jgi:predicted ester cyclase
MFKAFPDVRFTLEDMVAEGNKVMTRYMASGTHKAEFMGAPATGKKIKITGLEIRRLSGGKMVEYWGIMDDLGLMQQLGVVQKQ